MCAPGKSLLGKLTCPHCFQEGFFVLLFQFIRLFIHFQLTYFTDSVRIILYTPNLAFFGLFLNIYFDLFFLCDFSLHFVKSGGMFTS